ncbi:MAG: rhomboid family intramembrane serine protease [Schleiferilactobacillus harbinensis]|jgi:membrane associated rhomboid family serine protease|nr:rhomboid family intramembrane serine protease [Schleiferilactobacillus harbinensis]MCI1913390.1 rhomboid family intramembrane serine protease [Schleiferilactobacillus harbinensis]
MEYIPIREKKHRFPYIITALTTFYLALVLARVLLRGPLTLLETPIVGALALPALGNVAMAVQSLVFLFILGTYAEKVLGHWFFLAEVFVIGGLVQFLWLSGFVSTTTPAITQVAMLMGLVGNVLIGAARGITAPKWHQVLIVIAAFLSTARWLSGITTTAIALSVPLGLVALAIGLLAAIPLTSTERPFAIDWAQFPYTTLSLTLILVVIFGVEVGLNHGRYLGAVMGSGSLQIGSYGWNAVTWSSPLLSIWLHQSLNHLVNNVFMLLILGIAVERTLGHWRTLIIYLLGGMVAAYIKIVYVLLAPAGLFSAVAIGVGASAAIYALIGAGLGTVVFSPKISFAMKFLFYLAALRLVVLMAERLRRTGFFSATALIDDTSHLLGFLVGAFLTAALLLWAHYHSRQADTFTML